MSTLQSTSFGAARSLLINLTLRENRSKYKRSVLGWAWSMLNPIATMLIFTFVFSIVFRIAPPIGDPSGIQSFGFFLISGLLPWNFLAQGMTAASGSVIANAGLIKKVYFNRSVLPISSVLSWNTNLLIELGVLSVALLFVGQVVLPLIPVAVLVMFMQTFFVVGIGLALAALNVYFRDVEHFLQILLLLWFYASPVIYPIDYILQTEGMSSTLKTIYMLNPMVHFMDAYRSIFYDVAAPTAKNLLILLVCASGAMVVGWFTFNKLEARFAEEL
ncbi:MAG: ABC transporter permease [Actinomycetota bacterium]